MGQITEIKFHCPFCHTKLAIVGMLMRCFICGMRISREEAARTKVTTNYLRARSNNYSAKLIRERKRHKFGTTGAV